MKESDCAIGSRTRLIGDVICLEVRNWGRKEMVLFM